MSKKEMGQRALEWEGGWKKAMEEGEEEEKRMCEEFGVCPHPIYT